MVDQQFPGVRPKGLARNQPDNTLPIAGEDGAAMLQDGSRMVTRGAVTRDNGDFDIEQVDVADEPLEIPLEDVGGASIINIDLVSLGNSEDGDFDPDVAENPTDASKPFNVRVDTLAADGETVLTSRVPDAADGVESVRIGLGVFSDNERVVIEDPSGLLTDENLISGSINVQSGATDAVQIRGVDGTVQDVDNQAIVDALTPLVETLADSQTAFEGDAPVDEEGEIIQLDTRSANTGSLAIDATEDDAEYQLQARGGTGEPWFDFVDYDGDRVRDTLQFGARNLRIVVTSPSTVDGATADVSLQSSG